MTTTDPAERLRQAWRNNSWPDTDWHFAALDAALAAAYQRGRDEALVDARKWADGQGDKVAKLFRFRFGAREPYALNDAQADRRRVMLTTNGGPPEPATGTNTVILDAQADR